MSISISKNDLRQPRRISSTYIHDYNGVPKITDDDPAEKPWQRVPSTLVIVVLCLYLLLGYVTQLVEDDMPSVVKEESLAHDNSDTFSEEAAKRYLLQILGGKPRVSGTLFHLEKTQDMKKLVENIADQSTIPVVTDWQMVTGDFYLDRVVAPHVNFYHNCSNIIALLEGESGFTKNTIGSSILVNCHYDSVPFAQGASDNGVFCAAMVEILAKLSKRKTKLKHNVIFLFNGAEENGLQASHAFLQHPWSKAVTSVINLDAAGMNGKPAIFQVTDPRIVKAYSRSANRPTAQALGEFLFKTGLIPSDTDFRIFRDFGGIHGVDIAFTKWGHVYHTRNDIPELILPGVIQNAGNMLMGLITTVADVPEMDHKIEPVAAMYYDYLNWFMLTYSLAATFFVDALIAVLGVASVGYYLWIVGARWSSARELLYSVLGRITCMSAGILVSALCTLLMVLTTVQMRYLSHAWLVVPLYWMPYLITSVAVSHLYDVWRIKRSGFTRSLRTVQAQAATRLLLTIITVVLVCIPAASTMRYLITVPLFMLAITSTISLTALRYVRLTGWQHLTLEVALSLPSVMWLMSIALRLDAMMLPIMARSSSNTPDYTVAGLNVGLAVLIAAPVAGIELLFSRKRLWLVLSAVGGVCVILMFIPFSPYDDGVAVQRHYWFHSEISSYNLEGQLTSRSSGILVTRQDPYSLRRVRAALAAAGLQRREYSQLAAACLNHTYCGMPLYRTSFGRHYKNAMFLYTDPPAPFDPPVSFSVESKSCVDNRCSYTFVMTGGAHNLITIWPYSNVSVSGWSIQSPLQVSFTQRGRPVYVIYHSTPTYMEKWNEAITVHFTVPPSMQSGGIMEVSHHSHRLHHPQHYTAEYQAVLDAMPEYFHIASILSFRNNYVF